MKRRLTYITMLLFVVVGLGVCYLLTFYEYKSVFVLPDAESNRIKIADSLFIYPNLTIESHVGTNGNQVMDAIIGFDKVYDSINLKSLNIDISCVENPKENIHLTHVITYVDPLIPEDIEYVSATKFQDLPEHYKTVTLKREPWNTLQFFYETKNIELGRTYNYNIVGTILYKGKEISFRKEISVKRKKRFVHIQMMT
jgi:hypothetical protein